MTIGEASRQFQLALERRRSARTQAVGCVSFTEELDEVQADVDASRRQLDWLWCERMAGSTPR